MIFKTLKDLNWKNDFGEGEEITESRKERSLEDGTYPSVKIMDLREEAINWITKWKRDSIEALRTKHYPQAMISDTKIEVFKEFFNIEEKELK